MFEEWCKFILGDDIWGFGVVFILIFLITIPIVAINLGHWIVELPEVCSRLRELEEWQRRTDSAKEE